MRKFRQVTLLAVLSLFFINAKSFTQYEIATTIAEKINENNLYQTIKELSGALPVSIGDSTYVIPGRERHSPYNRLAAQYLYYKLKGMGLDANFTDTLYAPSYPVFETVYSIKKGTNPKKAIIIAGGFDTNTNPSDTIAPGANLNAAGVAIVIEAARIMQEYKTERTLVFALCDDMNFSGNGCFQLTDSLVKLGYDSICAIYVDKLAWKGENGYMQLNARDTLRSANIIKTFSEVNSALSLDEPAPRPKKYSTEFSKYAILNGFEEATFIRNNDNNQPYVHTIDDTFEHLELPFYLKNAKLSIASFAVLAGIDTKGVSELRRSKISTNNPCAEKLRIFSGEALGSFQISDAYGRVVYTGNEPGLEALIDMTSFAPGVYFVQCGGETAKFVKG